MKKKKIHKRRTYLAAYLLLFQIPFGQARDEIEQALRKVKVKIRDKDITSS